MHIIRLSLLIIIVIAYTNSLCAQKGEDFPSENIQGQDKSNDFVFAGSLLAYSAQNAQPQQLEYNQFFLTSSLYGQYNKNSKLESWRSVYQYEAISELKFGIFDRLDLNILVSAIYSQSKKNDSFSLDDTLILLGFQLVRSKKDLWYPDVRLLVGESFPTGKYDNLDIEMQGQDSVGSGSFETTFILSLEKVFPMGEKHAFRINPNIYFIIPSSTTVSNLNYYGGIDGTKDIAKPGNKFAIDLPLEYAITNYLVLGIDIFYDHNDKVTSKFGRSNQPSLETFSLAPCLEYNPSEDFGIEGGIWFSVYGRNSTAFTTGTLIIWWSF